MLAFTKLRMAWRRWRPSNLLKGYFGAVLPKKNYGRNRFSQSMFRPNNRKQRVCARLKKGPFFIQFFPLVPGSRTRTDMSLLTLVFETKRLLIPPSGRFFRSAINSVFQLNNPESISLYQLLWWEVRVVFIHLASSVSATASKLSPSQDYIPVDLVRGLVVVFWIIHGILHTDSLTHTIYRPEPAQARYSFLRDGHSFMRPHLCFSFQVPRPIDDATLTPACGNGCAPDSLHAACGSSCSEMAIGCWYLVRCAIFFFWDFKWFCHWCRIYLLSLFIKHPMLDIACIGIYNHNTALPDYPFGKAGAAGRHIATCLGLLKEVSLLGAIWGLICGLSGCVLPRHYVLLGLVSGKYSG